MTETTPNTLTTYKSQLCQGNTCDPARAVRGPLPSMGSNTLADIFAVRSLALSPVGAIASIRLVRKFEMLFLHLCSLASNEKV